MGYSTSVIKEAKRLRLQGVSYAEISAQLGTSIPKPTLAYWCRGVLLSAEQLQARKRAQVEHLARARKRSVIQKQTAALRQLETISQQARTVVQSFGSREVYLLALAMLYLGEGAKAKGHSGLLLGSSDPNIIQLYIALLGNCYSITVADLRCRISYRADQNLYELQKYWEAVTGIPPEHFYKTRPDPRTVGRPTKRRDYRGVCVITCRGRAHQLELQQISAEFLHSIRGL